MPPRPKIPLGTIAKQFRQVGRHPWIARKLAALELEKWLFTASPGRLASGVAGRIRQVSIRITDLCNLRCHTCGQWGDRGFLHGKNPAALRRREVPWERYLEVLADLTRHGHKPLVYLWGGEPMLYQGSLPLIAAAARLGLPVSVATNGTRLAEVAPDLVQAPLFLLQVSIDGHTPELHNHLRPAAGGGDNFADIARGLAAVHRARRESGGRLPLLASLTVISRHNYRHLIDIYHTFRDRIDLAVFYLSWWIDEPNAQAHDRDFSRRFGFAPRCHWGWLGDWQPEDYGELDRQLHLLFAQSRPWSRPPVVLLPPLWGEERLRTYYTRHQARFGYDRCISIYQAVEINANGDMSPCRDYHDYVVGNIKEHTITELWNSPAYRAFRRSLSREGLMPVCSRCCGLMGY